MKKNNKYEDDCSQQGCDSWKIVMSIWKSLDGKILETMWKWIVFKWNKNKNVTDIHHNIIKERPENIIKMKKIWKGCTDRTRKCPVNLKWWYDRKTSN